MRFIGGTLLFLCTCAPLLPAENAIPCILVNGTAYVHASYLCSQSGLKLDALRIIHHEPFVSIRSLSQQQDEAWDKWHLDTSGHSHLRVTGNCLGDYARHEYHFKLYQARDYWRCPELLEQRPWLVAWSLQSPAPHVNSLPAWPPTFEALNEVKACLAVVGRAGDPSGGWQIAGCIFNDIVAEMEEYLYRHRTSRR